MKHMFISTEFYDRIMSEKAALEHQVKDLTSENRALYDENKHLRSMIRLYEAAFNNGIEVNFPNSEPEEERTSDTGIDFDDF